MCNYLSNSYKYIYEYIYTKCCIIGKTIDENRTLDEMEDLFKYTCLNPQNNLILDQPLTMERNIFNDDGFILINNYENKKS
jgi:hypothetical protein